jgi:hypothetical protein
MKPFKRPIFLFLLVCCFLTACSSTQKAYLQNFRIYLDSDKDIQLTNDEIVDSPIDLIYVKNGDRSIATMALGFIENGQYKWLSKDDIMIVTQNGRVIKTLGLDNNLVFVDKLNSDPLSREASIKAGSWTTSIDTDYGDSGATIRSDIKSTGNVLLHVKDEEFNTVRVEESIAYSSVMYGEKSWVNSYWFDSLSGQLLQSHQTPSANSDRLEIVYISRALRLLEE